MIDRLTHVAAGTASPEQRADVLHRELELARSLGRGGLLLVVSSSDPAIRACQAELRRILSVAEQVVRDVHIADISREQILEALQPGSGDSIFWIGDLRWNHGRQAELWLLLNAQMPGLVAGRVRAVFWLTPLDAIDLAHYAPDLWAACQRVVEVGGAPTGLQPQAPSVDGAWDAWQSVPAAPVAAPADPKARSETWRGDERAANVLLTQGILSWRKGEHTAAVGTLKEALQAAQAAQDAWTEAEIYNALALVHSGAGRLDEAIDAYKQAIRLAPGPIPAWNNLGNLLAKASRNEDAAQAFMKALQTNPRDPIAWIGLGNVHLGKGELDHAAAAYRKSTRYMPDFAQAWNGLGDAYAAAGRLDDAMEAYSKAVELDPKYTTPRLRLGSLYARQQRYREAYTEYQDVLALDSRNQAAWDEFGIICLESGRYEEATAAFAKSIELGGADGRAYGNMAAALAEQGRYQEAVPLYQKSIQLLPGDRSAIWKKLADAYRMLDDYEQAARAYHMAERADDGVGESHLNPSQGAVSSAALPAPRAEEQPGPFLPSLPPRTLEPVSGPQSLLESGGMAPESAQSVDANPDAGGKLRVVVGMASSASRRNSHWAAARAEAESLNSQGNGHYRSGAVQDAIDAYNGAIEQDPTFGWPYANLALASLTGGKTQEALLLYQKSLELLNTDAERAVAWNGMGNVYRCLNDYTQALAAYKRAAELDPETAGVRDGTDVRPPPAMNNARAWNDLGEALMRTGALDEAIRAFRVAIELQPADGVPYCNLAGVLASLGQPRRAIPFYQKALERIEVSELRAAALNGLGDSYRRLGDDEQANDAYRRARELNAGDSTVLNRARLSLLGNRPPAGKVAVMQAHGGSDE